MRRRRIALCAFIVALAVSTSLYVTVGLSAYGRYQSVYGAFALACNGMLAWNPPSALWLGMYANQPALTSLQVRSATPALASVTLSAPGFLAAQTLELQSDSTFQSLAFKPTLLALAARAPLASGGVTRTTLQVTAQESGHGACEFSAPLTVYSREWILWRDPITGGDNTPYIAGWVTPYDPVISDLIGKASVRLHEHPELYKNLPNLYGYNEDKATSEQVVDQVNALFDTLQNVYHLHYSADNAPYTKGASQLVRTPSDVLTSAFPVGMCVETSVILAAAVERLGMRPYLVFTASHAYLGVALSDAPSAPLAYWETSDLNDGVLGAQANADGDAQYNSDRTAKAIKSVVDITYERARGVQPN
jgi:hypothetical protein